MLNPTFFRSSLFLILFQLLLSLTLSSFVSSTSRADEKSSRVEKLNPKTKIEDFLAKRLKVNTFDPFIINRRLADEITRGLTRSNKQAFDSEGRITADGAQVLSKVFSEMSVAVVEELVQNLQLFSYSNSMLVGPAGSGKSFILDQLVAIFSFGVLPEFIKDTIDPNSQDPFVRKFYESYIGKTQFVIINKSLLSKDNTVPGSAFPGDDTRMDSVINELFTVAQEDFTKNNIRTVFILEEVAHLPELVQKTLKTLLDKTGFKSSSEDPLDLGKEIGVSAIGITTPSEFVQLVGTDEAVQRRYNRVENREPSEEEALEILKGKKESWANKYGRLIEDSTLEYIISMRMFFSNPPLAMPDSVIRITEKFMSWSLNRKNMKDPESLTPSEDDFYRFLIHTTKLPAETWISSDPNKPPLWDLAERVKKMVVGHDREVERIAMRIRTSLINGFSEVPFFIIMGPTGSGKDTLIKAFNQVLFGHDGRHLNFDIGGLMSKSLSKIIHGTEDRLPLLVDRMNSGKPYGIIGLNEAKDAESQGFNSLKVLIEDRVIRPTGKDSRERHLGLYPVFILGQYGEEMLEGKTEKEIDNIVDKLTEEDLIQILIEGAGSQFGQMPESLIKRAIRSGGIHFLKPVKHKHFKDIARINLNRMLDRLAKKSKMRVHVDESILGFVSDTAILNKKDPRGLDGLLMNFVEVAISEATYIGPIPQRNVELKLSYRSENGSILVEQIAGGEVVKKVSLNPERLSLTRCEFLLGQ